MNGVCATRPRLSRAGGLAAEKEEQRSGHGALSNKASTNTRIPAPAGCGQVSWSSFLFKCEVKQGMRLNSMPTSCTMTRFEILLLVSSLAGSGHCLQGRFHAPWRPSVETSRAELNQKAVDGVSPVPTTAPRPYFAAIPELRRDVVSSNTCGFRTDDG